MNEPELAAIPQHLPDPYDAHVTTSTMKEVAVVEVVVSITGEGEKPKVSAFEDEEHNVGD